MEEISLAGLEFRDPDDRVVPVERLLDTDAGERWLVLQAIRYYG